METYTNVYYFYYLNAIGGTETFLYQLAKKYKNYDLTIFYRYADPNQLRRLRKYARCIQFVGQEIYCEKVFFNYGMDIIDNVHAKKYYCVIHADYEAMKKSNPNFKPVIHPKINEYIGVSKRACAGFTAVTGKKCTLSYNPFIPEKPKKVLRLISATRLTREKGKERMIKLAAMLDNAGIPYIWTVFTNDTKAIDNPNVIYMKPRFDITNYIADADYLVQLSDNEGYCYSVVEALSIGTPVIVTHCPVFDEIGLKDKVNCYLLDFDMQKVPIEDIYNKIPKNFTYNIMPDNWDNLFILKESNYQQIKDKHFEVEALRAYQDKNLQDGQLHRIPKKGERWVVPYERLVELLGENKLQIPFVKIVRQVD